MFICFYLFVSMAKIASILKISHVVLGYEESETPAVEDIMAVIRADPSISHVVRKMTDERRVYLMLLFLLLHRMNRVITLTGYYSSRDNYWGSESN
jgi:hypothetical protein